MEEEHIEAPSYIHIESNDFSYRKHKRQKEEDIAVCLKDAYIIYLNADESIDATRKGSLARFINHSCQPNCETRKWNVLGEVRVGIFAKQDIPFGTELSYNYNFEWYGGVMVQCLCGAASCSGFLGAKSRGFQEATYLWEDDDDRFSVENIPLYDSTDDEPTSINKEIFLGNGGLIAQYDNGDTAKITENARTESTNEFAPMMVEQFTASLNELAPMAVEPLAASSNEFVPMTIEPLNAIPMAAQFVENGLTEYSAQDTHLAPQNSVPEAANHQNQTESQNSSNHLALVPVKSIPKRRGRKPKRVLVKQMDIPDICNRLTSSVAREEILYCEEVKNHAASEIDALYDEIRPAIEEHERDSQDSVPTSLAEKWIEASCGKYKADFDLYAAIIKNIATIPLRSKNDMAPKEQNGLKYLENGS
nr:unnamed protein product [Digitaria exilis]